MQEGVLHQEGWQELSVGSASSFFQSTQNCFLLGELAQTLGDTLGRWEIG